MLIENQLERANLQHLGQLLAYLAGLEAKVVIWVATGFDEPHLSAKGSAEPRWQRSSVSSEGARLVWF